MIYKIGDKVRIIKLGITGEVIGIGIYIERPSDYRIEYVDFNRDLTSSWYEAYQLRAAEKLEITENIVNINKEKA